MLFPIIVLIILMKFSFLFLIYSLRNKDKSWHSQGHREAARGLGQNIPRGTHDVINFPMGNMTS